MRLLLDFPWELAAACGHDPVPQKVIKDFIDLWSDTDLEPVRFIGPKECADFYTSISQSGSGRNVHQLLNRFLTHCVRNTNGTGDPAVPIPEPPKLRDIWKCSLREELNDLTDWRNPQIIVPRFRHLDWQGGDEISLYCEQCGGKPASGPQERVLAVLEDYAAHPFTISDRDPWDVRCTATNGQHPCYLPNPLIPGIYPLQNDLRRIPIKQLNEKLAEAHRRGWQVGGKYLFLPPADWRPEDISQDVWRKGHAFPRRLVVGRNLGYLDSEGRVWLWDRKEHHWDIQLGGSKYIRVNHTGDRL